MNNGDFLQQLAALNWISKKDGTVESEKAKEVFAALLAFRLGKEVYQRISKEKEIEQAQAVVTLRVADYVKNHPRATESQLIDFIRTEFKNFAVQIDNL